MDMGVYIATIENILLGIESHCFRLPVVRRTYLAVINSLSNGFAHPKIK